MLIEGKRLGIREAPAKINLFLKVLDKRSDGYHNIDTFFLPIKDLFDTVEIFLTEDSGISIECNHSTVPIDETNLCVRAAQLFAKVTNISASWHIRLQKRIPVAAGLGGGSSDAAAIIHILKSFYRRQMASYPEEKIKKLLSKLGADIPFFLNPIPSHASGTGDILTPLNIDLRIPILLINPGFPVSTKWAYKNIDLCKQKKDSYIGNIQNYFASKDIKKICKNTYNSFDYPLFKKFPILELLSDFLHKNKAATVHISGSGPTLFAIFSSFSDLRKGALNLRKEFGGKMWFFPA
ncbi:MAG: 4-(cytidine 5'-diphospho)-2-C-methyl-D-erythritol kinase [Verrucomicrobiota bacterium]|nr:4-(cytidine 5'-diphospho)-2-C-methyl-D-erythritol kinase [Verrucomicrobiota bacterium]